MDWFPYLQSFEAMVVAMLVLLSLQLWSATHGIQEMINELRRISRRLENQFPTQVEIAADLAAWEMAQSAKEEREAQQTEQRG